MRFTYETSVDKKIILLNEFKYTKMNREFILNLFDNSIRVINSKFATKYTSELSGSKLIASSNYSPKEQCMDSAMESRLNAYRLSTPFSSLAYGYSVLHNHCTLDQFNILL
jgi:hypothetical protein